MTKEKVFCMCCKFIKEGQDVCLHGDNWIDNWHHKKAVSKGNPSNMNKNNDCKWYEARE